MDEPPTAALCILPGLDGTARLLDRFIEAARPGFARIEAVAYPTDRVLGYRELEILARDALPKDMPVVLLGESFSGPVAISIAAADPPPNLVGLVLSTTFAKSPVPLLSPFAALTRFAPVRALPTAALDAVLLGRWSTPSLRAELVAALRCVDPDVLRARAAAALRVDVSGRLRRIAVPTLALRAKHDRLLRPAAVRGLVAGIANAQESAFDGPHLLLQTRAQACAECVAAFASRLA